MRDYLPSFIDLVPVRYREPGYWKREFGELLGPGRDQARSPCRTTAAATGIDLGLRLVVGP